MQLYGDAKTSETVKFCCIFDKFFDCLHVRNNSEYIKKKKPNRKPYTDPEDERLNSGVSRGGAPGAQAPPSALAQ